MVSRELEREATIHVRVKKEEGTGSNVVGLLEGSDPKLREEAVVYTAHYDAYGIGSNGTIYPGAADNALGTSMITAIAEALSKTSPRPRRSVIFLAVTGEEYGLLGAKHWVSNPTWPLAKVPPTSTTTARGLNLRAVSAASAGAGNIGLGLSSRRPSRRRATISRRPGSGGDVFCAPTLRGRQEGVPALMLAGGPDGARPPGSRE